MKNEVRGEFMQSMIRFSVFGDFEKFSTSNLDIYMRMIDFFGKRGYKPATANELQLQPNGQSRVLIMPVFWGEMGVTVEISSNRINFQKSVEQLSGGIGNLIELFSNELYDLMGIFCSDMRIVANRVALNCDIVNNSVEETMPTQSSYYDNANKTEMSVRNVARKIVENEDSNIIIEKYVTSQGGFTKYSYDINSIAENTTFRFKSDDIQKLYKAYAEIAKEIEKGLK